MALDRRRSVVVGAVVVVVGVVCDDAAKIEGCLRATPCMEKQVLVLLLDGDNHMDGLWDDDDNATRRGRVYDRGDCSKNPALLDSGRGESGIIVPQSALLTGDNSSGGGGGRDGAARCWELEWVDAINWSGTTVNVVVDSDQSTLGKFASDTSSSLSSSSSSSSLAKKDGELGSNLPWGTEWKTLGVVFDCEDCTDGEKLLPLLLLVMGLVLLLLLLYIR